MSAEIVNLRQIRKQKARAAKQAQAAENRVVHGRTKAEREREAAARAHAARALDGARREPGDNDGR